MALLASPLSWSTNRTEFRHDRNNGSATSSNGVDAPTLFATLDAVKGAPQIAQFQFRATNEWISGTHNRSTIHGFYGAGQEDTSRPVPFSYDADHPAVLVGSNQGPTPIEFLLHAIAACLTSGLANIAAARGITLRRVSSTVEGDIDLLGILGLSDIVRNGYRQIRVHFDVDGDASPEQLSALVEQSRRRSAVYDVLVNGTDVQIDATPPDLRRAWDVVIIGGRLAGASAALLLARAGVRVLVVERARRGADTVSTHALMRGGVLQLHRWGLLDRVAATGAPPVRRVTFHYGHDSMPVTLKPYAGVDALYPPRRTVLDALLVGAAEEAGVRFGFGLAMTDVARDRAGRVVGVVVRDHLGATCTERAGLVVGADGRTSLVARQVGAPTVVAGSHAAAHVYGYWPAADLDGYHWYYGDGLSAGVIPTNDGRHVCSPPARRRCWRRGCATAARWMRRASSGAARLPAG